MSKVWKQRLYIILFDESLNHYLNAKQLSRRRRSHVRPWVGPEAKTEYISTEVVSAAQDIDKKTSGLNFSDQNHKSCPNLYGWTKCELESLWHTPEMSRCGKITSQHRSLWVARSAQYVLSSILLDNKLHMDSLTCTGWYAIALLVIRILCQQLHVVQPCFSLASRSWLTMSIKRGLLLWLHVKHCAEVTFHYADPLFTVEVVMFDSIATPIAFLTMYQAHQPILLFFYKDMHKIIKGKDNYIHGINANVLFYTLHCIRNTQIYKVWLFFTC